MFLRILVISIGVLHGNCFGDDGILKSADTKLEDAKANFLVNELNLNDFCVQVDGHQLLDTQKLLVATEWRSLVCKSGDSVLTERKIKSVHNGRRPQKVGLLRRSDGIYTIGGLKDDSFVEKYEPKEGYSLNLKYDCAPLSALFTMPNGVEAGDASAFKDRHPLLDRELISAEITEGGVRGFFAISRPHKIYQSIEFSDSNGGMPTEIKTFSGNPSQEKDEFGNEKDGFGPDGMRILCVTRVKWSEVTANLFVPILIEMEHKGRSTIRRTMQIKCNWFNVDKLPEGLLTPESLQARHRSEGFTRIVNIAPPLNDDGVKID